MAVHHKSSYNSVDTDKGLSAFAFHEQPEENVTYDLHVVHLQLIEPLRDKAAHYRLIVGVGRGVSESRAGLRA